MMTSKVQIKIAHDVSEVCTQCGICCGGTLFTHATIKDEDIEICEELGFDLKKSSKNVHSFNLPCNLLKDNSCSVYEKRPHKCKSYYCFTAQKVAKGTLPIPEASEIVAEAKRQSTWLIENAQKYNNKTIGRESLRRYLYSHYQDLEKRETDNEISRMERQYVRHTIKYLRHMEINFNEMGLLKKYVLLSKNFKVVAFRGKIKLKGKIKVKRDEHTGKVTVASYKAPPK